MSNLFYLCPQGSLLGHKLIQSRILLNVSQFLFTRVLSTTRIQLVNQIFWDLIYVPRIDIFDSFTERRRMSFQIGCFAEEWVTIKARNCLKECVNVAHVKYMFIVSQQSDSILVFLHTPPNEFTYNVLSTISIS